MDKELNSLSFWKKMDELRIELQTDPVLFEKFKVNPSSVLKEKGIDTEIIVDENGKKAFLSDYLADLQPNQKAMAANQILMVGPGNLPGDEAMILAIATVLVAVAVNNVAAVNLVVAANGVAAGNIGLIANIAAMVNTQAMVNTDAVVTGGGDPDGGFPGIGPGGGNPGGGDPDGGNPGGGDPDGGNPGGGSPGGGNPGGGDPDGGNPGGGNPGGGSPDGGNPGGGNPDGGDPDGGGGDSSYIDGAVIRVAVMGSGTPISGAGTPISGVGTPISGVGTPISGVGTPISGVEMPIRPDINIVEVKVRAATKVGAKAVVKVVSAGLNADSDNNKINYEKVKIKFKLSTKLQQKMLDVLCLKLNLSEARVGALLKIAATNPDRILSSKRVGDVWYRTVQYDYNGYTITLEIVIENNEITITKISITDSESD